MRRHSSTPYLPSPVLSEPPHRSLAPTKLAAGGTSLVRKVRKGDKSRPTGKKALSQVCIMLRRWGEKSEVGKWAT